MQIPFMFRKWIHVFLFSIFMNKWVKTLPIYLSIYLYWRVCFFRANSYLSRCLPNSSAECSIRILSYAIKTQRLASLIQVSSKTEPNLSSMWRSRVHAFPIVLAWSEKHTNLSWVWNRWANTISYLCRLRSLLPLSFKNLFLVNFSLQNLSALF